MIRPLLRRHILPSIMREKIGLLIFITTLLIAVSSVLLGLILLASSMTFVPRELLAETQWLFITTPRPVSVLPMTGNALAGYYVFLVATIVFSAVFLAKRDLLTGLRKITRVIRKQREPVLWEGNYLILFPRLLSMIFFIPFIWYFGVDLFGVGYTVPDFAEMSLWENFFGFANASVWEELVTRVLFLGLPLAVYYMILEGGWKPRNMTGFGEVDGTAFVLLVFSSLMFAAAHAYGGWDVYKIPPTFFTGMALGYAFIRRGLPGAIILHFALDFFTVPYRIWPAVEPVISLAFIPLVIAGGYYTLGYSREFYELLRSSMTYYRNRTPAELQRIN